MSLKEKIKCRLGRHDFEKFMGVVNRGRGKFAQKYKCRRCGKIKEKLS